MAKELKVSKSTKKVVEPVVEESKKTKSKKVVVEEPVSESEEESEEEVVVEEPNKKSKSKQVAEEPVEETKTKKSDKSTKQVKVKGAPNDATKRLDLHFNVVSTKKWLNTYLATHIDEVYMTFLKTRMEKKLKDGEDKECIPKIKVLQAQAALTACDEVICLSLVNLTSDKVKKGDSGLYTVTAEHMMDCVRLNSNFDYTFSKFLNKYDSQQDYLPSLKLNMIEVKSFIEKFAFNGGNTNIQLDTSAYNFLMYILYQNRILLTDTAYQMMMYSKKPSVDFRAIQYAVNVHYKGTLKNDIMKKVEEKWRLVKADKPDDKSEEKPEKKVEKTKGKSKAKAKDEEDEDEEDEDEEDEEDSDDE